MKLKCDRCGTTGYRGADRQPDKFHEGCPAKVADSKNIMGIWRSTDAVQVRCDGCGVFSEDIPHRPHVMCGDLGRWQTYDEYGRPLKQAPEPSEAHDGCRNTCCHREATAKENERILGLIQAARSEFFHASAAWALDKLAERIAGLPHATSDVTKQAASVEEDKAARRHASLACRGCGALHRPRDLAEGLLCFKCCGLPHGGKDEEP